VSAPEQRTAALSRVTTARAALSRLHTAAADRPPMGLVAEAAHLERVVEAWAELAEASRAAAQLFTQPSPPFVGLMAQHTKASQQVTRLRVDLVGKQAEVQRRQARVRGER
jgi:hypothetical protein